jgi:hypothetical protein
MTPAARARAVDTLTRSQGHSRAGMRHGAKKTSTAQLRYMRMLAREHHTDVGPACCAVHSSEWTDGLLLTIAERSP